MPTSIQQLISRTPQALGPRKPADAPAVANPAESPFNQTLRRQESPAPATKPTAKTEADTPAADEVELTSEAEAADQKVTDEVAAEVEAGVETGNESPVAEVDDNEAIADHDEADPVLIADDELAFDVPVDTEAETEAVAVGEAIPPMVDDEELSDPLPPFEGEVAIDNAIDEAIDETADKPIEPGVSVPETEAGVVEPTGDDESAIVDEVLDVAEKSDSPDGTIAAAAVVAAEAKPVAAKPTAPTSQPAQASVQSTLASNEPMSVESAPTVTTSAPSAAPKTPEAAPVVPALAATTPESTPPIEQAGKLMSNQPLEVGQAVDATGAGKAQVKAPVFQLPQQQTAPSLPESNIDALTSHIRHNLGGGKTQHTMTIRLDPPALGSMRVSVSMQDGQMTAMLSTSSDVATKLLQQSLPHLRASLEQAGLQVDRIQIGRISAMQQAGTDGGLGQNQSEQQGGHNQDAREQMQQNHRDQQRRETLRRLWRNGELN